MEKPKIDPSKLKRTNPTVEVEKPEGVSQGVVDRVIDLAFNPSREKIREVTIIDRVQGRLLPQLDLVADMWNYVKEVALFRKDANLYKEVFKKDHPVPPMLIDEFMYRTAQWQKSVQGKNLERATDIALAETEVRGDEDFDNNDAWAIEK